MAKPQILVLRLSSLGDLILTSSFLRTLQIEFPESDIDIVVREDFATMASLLPHIRRVIVIPRRSHLLSLLSISRDLAGQSYAHVFDVHRSLRSRVISFYLRSKLHSGFHKQSVPRWLLIHFKRNWYSRFGGVQSLRQRMLEPLRRMGLRPQLQTTSLNIPPHVEQSVQATRRRYPEEERWIGIAPGARWPSKIWPTENFNELVARLAENRHYRFVLVGDVHEAPLAFATSMAAPQRCLCLAGKIDLVETAAYLRLCDVVISNDSALLHLAEGVGRPVIALFGPTTPEFGYAPYRAKSKLLHQPPSCSPCSKNGQAPCHRDTHECMENINVETVYRAVTQVLD